MFGIRYEVRTALRISVWFGTVVTVQGLVENFAAETALFASSCCDSRGGYEGLRVRVFNLLKPNDIYIYIYISYRSANLQTLHFKYLFNKCT